MRSNTRSIWLGLATGLVFILALTLGACRSTQTPGTQVNDAAITSRVTARLAADPDVNPFEIDVDTNDGVVRLSGMVESERQRSEALALAHRTSGVRGVINDIELGDPTAEENINDSWIVTKIKSKLAADPDVNPLNIDVDVLQGRVTLTGKVAKEYARERAGQLARRTQGVVSVDNRIMVRSR